MSITSVMTNEDYGASFERGFLLTVRFLTSKGICVEMAEEAAQAAWVKGWEHLDQLRNASKVITWVNSIALNVYRNFQRGRRCDELPELPMPPAVNLAAIDVERVFRCCKAHESLVLQRRYLEGLGIEEMARMEGRTEGAIRLRLLRARRSARAILAEAA